MAAENIFKREEKVTVTDTRRPTSCLWSAVRHLSVPSFSPHFGKSSCLLTHNCPLATQPSRPSVHIWIYGDFPLFSSFLQVWATLTERNFIHTGLGLIWASIHRDIDSEIHSAPELHTKTNYELKKNSLCKYKPNQQVPGNPEKSFQYSGIYSILVTSRHSKFTSRPTVNL